MTNEKAIDLLDNLIGMIEDNHNSDYDKALKIAIKSLEQEQKTGHWIYDGESDLSKCSICGAYCPHDELGRIETYYCSYCGAKISEIPTSPERNGKEESEVQE